MSPFQPTSQRLLLLRQDADSLNNVLLHESTPILANVRNFVLAEPVGVQPDVHVPGVGGDHVVGGGDRTAPDLVALGAGLGIGRRGVALAFARAARLVELEQPDPSVSVVNSRNNNGWLLTTNLEGSRRCLGCPSE
ncbi:hypothetical protein PG984_010248 [Apiospora sp. TS-2023a]